MPKPRKGESRSNFVSRAIPILMDEGLSQKQAVGKAEGMYTHYTKRKSKKSKHEKDMLK